MLSILNFDSHKIPLEDWIEIGVTWLVKNFRPQFQAIKWPVEQTLITSTVAADSSSDRPVYYCLANRGLAHWSLQCNYLHIHWLLGILAGYDDDFGHGS